MDITNLRLSTFKILLRKILDKARQNGSAEVRHLKITYSWVRDETDEDLFELLKKGFGGDYIRKVLKGE
jgi:hypothetical protein